MQENKVDGAGVRVFCILWFSGHNFFTWVDGNKILEEFLKYLLQRNSKAIWPSEKTWTLQLQI